MKKAIFTLLMISLVYRTSLAIDFYPGTYQQALVKARTEKKPLFLYFTAKWCGPCQYMQQYIFPDTTLSTYIKQTYIALKIDIDTQEGKLIYVKSHQPKSPMGVPAFIIMNDNEEVLKTAVGGMKVAQLRDFLLKDVNEKVVYKALTDSIATMQIKSDQKKPTMLSELFFNSMMSNWKPALKIGVNLMDYQTKNLTTGYELGVFFDRSFKSKTLVKSFWHSARYHFQPGLMLTSKSGVLDIEGTEKRVNIHYLELGLFNNYQIKKAHGLQISVNPYAALGLWGNIKVGDDKQKINFNNDFNRIDYGVKLGIAKEFGTLQPYIGYNLGLKNIQKGLTSSIYNRGFYLSFAMVVGK